MIVSINQPAYLPWLGYFHRLAASDLHIVLDHVQFEKNSFTNRNKLKTFDGWCWITIPVMTKGKFGDLAICSLEINNSNNWRDKHWKTICQYYKKAPFFQNHQDFFENFYRREWQNLSECCRELTQYLLKNLGINTTLLYSSEMDLKEKKDELVLEICQKVGADIYLSGILGQNYLNEDIFKNAGIKVIYQNYHHPVYQQYIGGSFEPYMSVIDLLFNYGVKSLDILTKGQEAVIE